MNVGEVQKEQSQPTLTRPTYHDFAKAFVDRIGCGRWEVTPYITHVIPAAFVKALGEKASEWVAVEAMKPIFKTYAKSE